ncbi:hypothetical protein TWF718_000872 [Orbilia javanica]|uniref:Fungal N-terminal domain-containing protein n=1 Tax=Orbilia javanica TaxID=47235 RepID=A0AAN8MXT0_9PEZI
MAMPIQIGDVIALANMCYGIAQAFGSGRKAAPVEFREVQNELYGLGQMLDLLKTSVESGAIGPTVPNAIPSPLVEQAYESIARMIENCQATIWHLKEFAKRYSPLAGVEFIEERGVVKVRKLPSTSRQRIKLNWKRIMWVKETSNIQGIRDQISIHVQSINAVVSLVNTYVPPGSMNANGGIESAQSKLNVLSTARHKTNAVQEEVRNLSGYAEGHRMDLHGARTEIHGARREIYNVQMGVSAANAGVHHVSSEVNLVRQDVQSLNHKLEAIIAWQQRDMPAEQLKQQLSHLFIKLEQLERMPAAAAPHPCPPLSTGIPPYPMDDAPLEMPHPFAQSTTYLASSQSTSTAFYASSNSSMPNFSSHNQHADFRSAPRSYTQVTSASISIAPVELPTRRPTRKNGFVPSPFETPNPIEPERIVPVVNLEPVEIAEQPIREEDRPPRASRATATDIVFELCLETRVGDGVAVFETICLHARFHGNWKNAIENGEYNEGLFACLCEPFDDEDEDFEPHAQKLERFTLTNGTIGCHYHGKVQWILHNVKDSQARKPVTLGIRNLSMHNEMKFERAFTEPIAFKTAKAISTGEQGNYFAYEVDSEIDGRQVAILNSMADDSFQAYLESVTFRVEDSTGGIETIIKRNVTHTNLLHYKTIGVEDIADTLKRDAFKHSEHVEMLVHFLATRTSDDEVANLKLLLDEINLESNSSEDNCIVTLTMTKGEADFRNRTPRLQKVTGVAEFKFRKREAADNFLQQLKYMSNELHALKIQHAKRNEHVMVKLFAEHIAAANNVSMNDVEIVVVWDEVRRKGRILARSRDGSCYLSQTLHANFFERFAELKRGNLFNGAAEFYRPTRQGEQKVEKLPEGVGRIQFKDSTTDNLFYARLTESAKRFGFAVEPKTIVEAPKSESQIVENSDDRSIVQTRGKQLKRSPTTRNYSAEHYKRIVMETAAIEYALPTQKLTRPLDAEELLDLLNQTEEKLLYDMGDPKPPIIEDVTEDDPSQPESGSGGAVLTPSQPSEWTAEDLTIPKRFRKQLSQARDAEKKPVEGTGSASLDATSQGERKAPQTASTTPGLLTPEDEQKHQLRRPASFDTLRRDRESQKVFIPPEALDKSGVEYLFPGPANPKHQRSQSTGGSHTLPATSSSLKVAPGGAITNERDIVQSPESYDPGYRRGNIETEIDSSKSTINTPVSISIPGHHENSVDDTVAERGYPPAYEEQEESLYDLPFSSGSSSLPIVATEKNIRAYRLTADFDTELPHGTLVWVDESDSTAKKFEQGVTSIKVSHFQTESFEWVPKGMLKQGRYYAMKAKEGTYRTTDEDGSVVKLRSNQIVVPLEDEADGKSKGNEFRVVPLEARYSVPVSREWVTEVNLSFQMPRK